MNLNGKKFRFLAYIFLISLLFTVINVNTLTVKAMPFYGLSPKFLTVRSNFSTTYEKSSSERKSNIKLAAKSINGTLVDVGGEFSFNMTVGPRTEKRGYKSAKIISGGEFVDGVGGGVCQVSTTLYNAAVLAGLKISEYHPHSLPVSYVAPSFDAMVNSGSADLRFVNNTDNPIVVMATANGEKLTVKIIGEPLGVEFKRVSTVIKTIPAPDYLVIKDDKNEYPDLYEGERLYLSYSKDGIKSQGYVETYKNGKLVNKIKLRTDTYSPVQGKVVIGVSPRPALEQAESDIN